jgi:hypothetical protein
MEIPLMARIARNIILLLSCMLVAVSAFASTYYIDCAAGNDSNNGMSKATPWKHAPGMKGTTNGVGPGAIDDAAGDKCGSSPCSLPGTNFIFKGGVSCGAGDFTWTIRETGTGTGANGVYFGVDQTWFSGSAWARPVMDFGGSASSSKCNPQIQMAPVSYVVIDNLEFTNNYWDHTCNGSSNGTVGTSIAISSATHSEFKNLYVHGWDHEAYSPNHTADVCDIFAGTNSGNDNNSLHDSVVDGSDTATHGYACAAVWGAPTTVYNMVIRYVPNGGIVEFPVSWHDNLLEYIETSFDPTQHNQAFEDNGSTGSFYFYNNLIRHTTNANGLTLNFAPEGGATTYVFNNVEYDTDDSPLNVQALSGSGGTLVVENNTIELGADSTPGTGNSGVGNGTYPGCPTNMTSCVYRNNHFIGNNNQSSQICQASCTNTTNVSQTKAVANAQGYNIAENFAMSPTPGGATIGAGTDLSSLAVGKLISLASDTTYSCSYQSSNHTVNCPMRTVNPRGTKWDAGAYFFAANGGAPQPPVGLVDTVQ